MRGGDGELITLVCRRFPNRKCLVKIYFGIGKRIIKKEEESIEKITGKEDDEKQD